MDVKVAGPRAEGSQLGQRSLHDARGGPAPACVGQTQGTAGRIDEEDGHAVGDGNGEQEIAAVADQRVGIGDDANALGEGVAKRDDGVAMELAAASDALQAGGGAKSFPSIGVARAGGRRSGQTEVEISGPGGDALNQAGKALGPVDLAEDAQPVEGDLVLQAHSIRSMEAPSSRRRSSTRW